MIILIVSIMIALLFLFLGFLALRKDWSKTFTLCLFFAFGSFVLGQEWFQGFLKTQVLSTVLFSLKKYGDKIENFHKTIETISKELYEQQLEHSKTQSEIKGIQGSIIEQQKKLENIELLVKNIFERITHEQFFHTQVERMQIHEIGERSAIVVFRLKSIPIYQTVQIQYHVSYQPRGSYYLDKNIVILIWGDSVVSLRNRAFIISYVADPTVVDVYKTLVRKEKEIYANERRLVWVSDEGKPMLELDDTTIMVTIDAETNKFIFSKPKATPETSSQ
jgi:hypothetical protein